MPPTQFLQLEALVDVQTSDDRYLRIGRALNPLPKEPIDHGFLIIAAYSLPIRPCLVCLVNTSTPRHQCLYMGNIQPTSS